ncbi:MAG: hypothetical protein KBT68_07390 [bacterium]|nr:hypothetical protein [Candidatus Colisoma equi]
MADETTRKRSQVKVPVNAIAVLFAFLMAGVMNLMAETITYVARAGWNYPGYLIGTDKAQNGDFMWSDEKPAHDNADYLINGDQYRLFSSTEEYPALQGTFPGNSLTVMGATVQLWVSVYHTWFTIPRLVVNEDSTLIWNPARYSGSTSLDFNVCGNDWDIEGQFHYWSGAAYRRMIMRAEFKGAGLLKFKGSSSSANANNDPRIVSTNSLFKGRVSMELEAPVDFNSAMALEISHPYAIGGPMDEFNPAALELGSYQGLRALESMTLDTENRGIYGAGTMMFFETPADVELAVKQPLRLSGGFYKKGAGTLALGAEISFGADGNAEPDGANSQFNVQQGVVKPLTSTALKG